MLRFASVCSGVEAPSLAWESLGWEPQFYSEIEPVPALILDHHWPEVPNLGDMSAIPYEDWTRKVDVFFGGTPCQAFSVSGKRGGLKDARGNLALTFAIAADIIDPDYVVWENVPGVLSDDTNAFGCLLGALSGEDDPLLPPGGKWAHAGFVLGPKRTIAWRLLDAQRFGLPLQRNRVFVVAAARGSSADPRAVLFEQDGLSGDSHAGGAPAEEVPADPAGGDPVRGRERGEHGEFVYGNAEGSRGLPYLTSSNLMKGVNNQTPLLAFKIDADRKMTLDGDGDWWVRRFTPLETERLMGMPDHHTRVPQGKRETADQPRFKAIGNSIAVPCLRWIGERIERFDREFQTTGAHAH